MQQNLEVLFRIFYYYWGEEYRLLYRGLRYIEVPLVALWLNDFLAVLGDRQKQKVATLMTVCYLHKGAMSSFLLSFWNYLQITRSEMAQPSCKRDTKSKSHVGMKLAPVRVISCKHPLSNITSAQNWPETALFSRLSPFKGNGCLVLFECTWSILLVWSMWENRWWLFQEVIWPPVVQMLDSANHRINHYPRGYVLGRPVAPSAG